jgi:hypothetical protein
MLTYTTIGTALLPAPTPTSVPTAAPITGGGLPVGARVRYHRGRSEWWIFFPKNAAGTPTCPAGTTYNPDWKRSETKPCKAVAALPQTCPPGEVLQPVTCIKAPCPSVCVKAPAAAPPMTCPPGTAYMPAKCVGCGGSCVKLPTTTPTPTTTPQCPAGFQATYGVPTGGTVAMQYCKMLESYKSPGPCPSTHVLTNAGTPDSMCVPAKSLAKGTCPTGMTWIFPPGAAPFCAPIPPPQPVSFGYFGFGQAEAEPDLVIPGTEDKPPAGMQVDLPIIPAAEPVTCTADSRWCVAANKCVSLKERCPGDVAPPVTTSAPNYKKWWFWAALGGAAVATTATVVVVRRKRKTT